MVNMVEEISLKQAANPKGNILPLATMADYELVYAGDDWRYEYHDYKRSDDKKGCELEKKGQEEQSVLRGR